MNSEIIKYLIPAIIGLLGVILGALLSFWANYVIKSRETSLRIQEKIFDRKIEAYENLLLLSQNLRKTNGIKANNSNNYLTRYHSSLQNKQCFDIFFTEYKDIANKSHFWVNVEIIRLLDFFKDYLNHLAFVLHDIPEEKYIDIGLIITKDFIDFALKLEGKLINFFENEITNPAIKTKRGFYKYDSELYNQIVTDTALYKNEQIILRLK